MVTSSHEASHRIFQDRPELLAPVFRLLGVPLPSPAAVEVLSPDATEIRPLERRVDSVLRIRPEGAWDDFLLAIEAQGRRDPAKRRSWAYYLGHLGAKYDCPVLLLVTCQDRSTARWASGPFSLGPDGWRTALTVHPLVLGPDNVPVITEPEHAARDLALATFSAMTHGNHPDAAAILEALAAALGAADGESAEYFTELLEIGLGDSPARATWRKLMSMGTFFPGRGTIVEESYLKGMEEGREEGCAAGRAHAVLRLLEKRGVPTLAATRARITGCTDLDLLDVWFDRALTVTDATEIFDRD
ncbi:hypothetical protein RM572_22960 [Streptomyces sp. DSM 42041]|uniref:DUF4351 domain-containing protein n=1 Tax=Streptomyces hazeniae TaxID=3075538 RepID=A0ABU2NY49_9ACTN|nr:hypothetical protein [Streptomyces sp. DSM 42041]MDT0381625.1 hypothetical protein [Streptomyces sp. DSM 42041]